MRKALIVAALAVSGCVELEPTPAPPTPEALKLSSACQAGNLDACAYIETARANDQQRRIAAYSAWQASGAGKTQPMAWPQMQPMQQTAQRTTCRQVYGQFDCTSY